jgi:hypothetical protein
MFWNDNLDNLVETIARSLLELLVLRLHSFVPSYHRTILQ